MKLFNYSLCLCFWLSICTALSAQINLSRGLVLNLPFDSHSWDVSGNGLHATNVGASYTADRHGEGNMAADFDGINDYMQLLHHPLFDFSRNQSFSIAIWVKIPLTQFNTNSTDNDIISKFWGNSIGDGFPFSLRMVNRTSPTHNGRIGGSRYDYPCHTSAIGTFSEQCEDKRLNDNQWHHIVFMRTDGGMMRMYVDGRLVNEHPDLTTCSVRSNANIYLGNRGGPGGDYYFRGAMDDLHIYNRELNPSEIQYLYNGTTQPQTQLPPTIFDFYQVDYMFEEDTLLNSPIGGVIVDVNELREHSGQQGGFINLVTAQGWVIQNVCIPNYYSYSSLGIPFYMSAQSGVDISYLSGHISFTPYPIFTRPPGPFQDCFLVEDEEVNAQGLGVEADLFPFRPHIPAEAMFDLNGEDWEHDQPDHPNIQAAKNQCGPMAIANSLQYLENLRPEWLNLPDEHIPGQAGGEGIVAKIDEFAGRNVRSRRDGDGITGEQGLKGKLKYLAVNDITNIKTMHMGAYAGEPDFGNREFVEEHGNRAISSKPLGNEIDLEVLFDAIRKNKDIEFAYTFEKNGKKGHFVEIVGGGVTNGVPYLRYLSDTNQNSDQKGTTNKNGDPNVKVGQLSYDEDGTLRMRTDYGYVYPALCYIQCVEPPKSNLPPVIFPTSYCIPENSPIGTIVGQIQAFDPEGAPLIFEIVGGNLGNVFSIDRNNGTITVNNSNSLDYEVNPVFKLIIRVRDNCQLKANAEIEIRLKDVDEPLPCNQNIALNRPVFVSSSEFIYPGHYAVDGNENTRWSSQHIDNQWIYVDLGDEYELCRVILKWERAFARGYQLLIWNGFAWQLVRNVTGNNSLHNVLDNLNVSARYVAILGTERATPWGISLFEYEIYGYRVSARRKENTAPNIPPFISEEKVQNRPQTPLFSEGGLSLYPNPASQLLNLRFSLDKNVNASIQIVDMQGKVIITQQRMNSMGENNWQIEIGHLPTGVYVLRLITDSQNYQKRFVKE